MFHLENLPINGALHIIEVFKKNPIVFHNSTNFSNSQSLILHYCTKIIALVHGYEIPLIYFIYRSTIENSFHFSKFQTWVEFRRVIQFPKIPVEFPFVSIQTKNVINFVRIIRKRKTFSKKKNIVAFLLCEERKKIKYSKSSMQI